MLRGGYGTAPGLDTIRPETNHQFVLNFFFKARKYENKLTKIRSKISLFEVSCKIKLNKLLRTVDVVVEKEHRTGAMDFVQLVSFIAVTLTVCMFMAGM